MKKAHGHHKNHHHNKNNRNIDQESDNEINDILTSFHITPEYAREYHAPRAGTSGDDQIVAGKKPTMMFGMDGDDTLISRAKGDMLFGGKGNDILTGGAGDDAFFFKIGDGHDIVTDFESGPSGDIFRIHLEGQNPFDRTGKQAANFLEEYGEQVGDSVVITLNENDSIEFQNMQMADLAESMLCLW